MSLLTLHSLTTGYQLKRGQTTCITTDINQTVETGELICLLGVNGSGKSTLIRTICGFQSPLAGKILLGETDLEDMSANEIAQTLSVVLTERPRVGAMTVYSMVALGRHPYTDWTGRLSESDDTIIRQVIRDAGAESLIHRLVSELSDGEFQKVMIARALAQEPSLMVLDEPTAFLDLPRSVELMRMLKSFAHNHGKAVICATHDLTQALETADTLWIIDETEHLHSGAPEDLVLDGTLKRVFDSDEVFFDADSATFKMQHHPGMAVELNGSGIAFDWTHRALERIGCEVCDGSPLKITITESDGASAWELTGTKEPVSCTSIGELMCHLRGINEA